jgi:DNA-binding transcriptional ArsR family regulator
MPDPNAIVLPETVSVKVRLDPVQNIIHSMVLLVRSEDLSGLNPWIYETYEALTPEQRERHYLVVIGLHYAVLPTRQWQEFPAYLQHLETCDPLELRDQVLDAYLTYNACIAEQKGLTSDKTKLLDDKEFFLNYLQECFEGALMDLEVEKQAHDLLNRPEEMQQLITSHLRFLWEAYYQEEWQRVKPMAADAVRAFDGVDISGMSRSEAAQYITGQELSEEHWHLESNEIAQLVFVPNAHIGPYLGRFRYKNTLGVIFGARLPKESQLQAPDLNRNEINVRLSALADDVRLRILKLVAEQGELRSPEIIEQLDLSQSAASRHLKQLSATGYLTERRCSGAKCYALNGERLRDTLQAVSNFLLGE